MTLTELPIMSAPSDEYVTKHGADIERRYPYREALRMMVENRDYVGRKSSPAPALSWAA